MFRRYLCPFDLDVTSECFDAVIVGGGVSGLFAALCLPTELNVLVVSKASLEDCNSYLAQGGIAITLDDDYKSHIEDTLEAGSYYNNPAVVEAMIKSSHEVYALLKPMAVDFDTEADGSLSQTGEGGHSKRRIIHHKDITGEALMDALILEARNRKNIVIRTNETVLDVITGVNQCIQGVVIMGTQVYAVRSSHVVIATGGIGGLFENTTNSSVVTGDGIAMVLRAGVGLKDAEFIQFHPTAMAMSSGGYFLISEAVRGEGGYLVNGSGQRFMAHQHRMKELAPRDVVAKAINEQIQSGETVFVDVRHFEDGYFPKRFPKIYSKCLENGIDPLTELIPVTPVEHYYMGGIGCDDQGRTTLKGLFVTGEAASSGFHGANRLASNSLLECLVLSMRVAKSIVSEKDNDRTTPLCNIGYKESTTESLQALNSISEANWQSLRTLVTESLTIVRHRKKLRDVLNRVQMNLLGLISVEIGNHEAVRLINGLMVVAAICEASLKRTENLGSFLIEE